MAKTCGGETLDGSRCQRLRNYPPCHDHTDAALARRARRRTSPIQGVYWRRPRPKAFRVCENGLHQLFPVPAPPARPLVRAAAQRWADDHGAQARSTLLAPLPEKVWDRFGSPHSRIDCAMLEFMARVCEAPGVRAQLLEELATGGIAEVNPILTENLALRELAKHSRDRVSSLIPGELLPLAPELRSLALCLRLLGVYSCAARRRLSSCVCLEALDWNDVDSRLSHI